MTTDQQDHQDHQTQDPDLVDAQSELIRHADRLTTAIGWLAVLSEPGRERPGTPPLLSDAQIAHRAAEAAREAAERAAAGPLAGVAGALAPSPAPINLTALDAIVRAGRAMSRLAETVEARTHQRPPRGRPEIARDVLDLVTWLAGAGTAGWAVHGDGSAVHCGVLLRPGTSWSLVVQVAARLDEIASEAHASAGISDDRVIPSPGGRCPACGGRALRLDATIPNNRWWTVRCISAACRCTGPGCGCAMAVRYPGRQHAWSSGEFERLQASIEARRPKARVGSTRAGRGGGGM